VGDWQKCVFANHKKKKEKVAMQLVARWVAVVVPAPSLCWSPTYLEVIWMFKSKLDINTDMPITNRTSSA
jgi:hypothetical protein